MAKGPVVVKTIVVGYGGVGKTCMLITFHTGKYPDEYIPTVWEHENYSCELDGKQFCLSCWDTGGGEDYPRLRPFSYPGTDVFLLLFDVAGSKTKYEEVESYWTAELRHHCPKVPIILVGSKIDLREGESQTLTTEQGEAMAEKIGAAKYMEISSLKNIGVTELFNEALRIGNEKKRKSKKKCVIL